MSLPAKGIAGLLLLRAIVRIGWMLSAIGRAGASSLFLLIVVYGLIAYLLVGALLGNRTPVRILVWLFGIWGCIGLIAYVGLRLRPVPGFSFAVTEIIVMGLLHLAAAVLFGFDLRRRSDVISGGNL